MTDFPTNPPEIDPPQADLPDADPASEVSSAALPSEEATPPIDAFPPNLEASQLIEPMAGEPIEEPSWNPLPPSPAETVARAQASPLLGGPEPPATPWAEPTQPVPASDEVDWPGLPEQSFAPSFSRPELYDAWNTAPEPDAQLDRPEKKPRRLRSLGVPLLAGLVGASLALVGFLVFDDDPAPAEPIASAAPAVIREQVRTELVPSGGAGSTADPAAVARKVIPSIVHVQVGNGGADAFNVAGSGSGVVLTEDGLIVTNGHVVEGSSDVQVVFADGRIYQAEIVGTDARTDLAVLDIDAEGLIPIDIGSARDLVIGDVAIAAGNPLGLRGGPSLTVGVISAFGRQVTTGNGLNDTLYGMLQTDAPITRGSSGGALVDGNGALIGITSAVGVSDVGVEGIGFAIPVERVQRITDEIIANGNVSHSFLGIGGITFFAEQLDGSQVPTGIAIETFEGSESAAQDAGLEVGDVITELNGTPLHTMEALIAELLEHRVGESIEIKVDRAGEVVTVDILLGERPADLDQ